MQPTRFSNPTFLRWFAGASLIGLVILNAIYIWVFSDGIPSLTVRGVIKGISGAMLIYATVFVLAIRNEARSKHATK